MSRGFTPYQIDRSVYKRFDQRNICFERRKWDKGFIAHGRGIYDRAHIMMGRGIKGYGREEFAALKASWYLHDAFRKEASSDKDELKEVLSPREVGGSPSTGPQEESARLKEFASCLGAPIVGTTRVKQEWIYSVDTSGKPIHISSLRNAVVFAIPMDQRMLKESPTFIASTAVGVAYSKCRSVAESLARYIEQLGYRALPVVNEVALSVPLAIDAGLGEFGRNGLLITNEYGMGVRIGKVLTDMPLPQDSPVDLGVRGFCEICKKCAESCPVNAISFADSPDGKTFSKSNNPGIFKWYVKVDKCYRFWTSNGSDCSNCVISCPFTKPRNLVHNTVRSVVKRTRAFNRILLIIDRLVDKASNPPRIREPL